MKTRTIAITTFFLIIFSFGALAVGYTCHEIPTNLLPAAVQAIAQGNPIYICGSDIPSTTGGTEGSGGSGGGTNSTGSADSTTNMNAMPNDDGSKDANGWPTYLNVPEYCAGPETGEVYTFSAPRYDWSTAWIPTVGPVAPGTPGRIQGEMFRDENAGGQYWTIMGKSESYALPFYSANSDDWAFSVPGGISTGDGRLSVGLSECPGDFDRQDGAPEGCFQEAVTTGAKWSASTSEGHKCLIEPGKRYFLNLRMSDVIGSRCTPKPETGVCNTAGGIKNSFMYESYSEFHFPPYTGPCLTQRPYPVNYESSECYKPDYIGAYSDGRCAWGGESRGRPEGSTKQYTCTDGVGGEVLAEYTYTCQNGRYGVTSGRDIPATPNMVCKVVSTEAPLSNFDGCLLTYAERKEHDFSVAPLGSKKHMFYDYGDHIYREWTCKNNYKWEITDSYNPGGNAYPAELQTIFDKATRDSSNRYIWFEI